MSDYDACPYCGKKRKNPFQQTGFRCTPAGDVIQNIARRRAAMPECGADDYGDYDKVYAD